MKFENSLLLENWDCRAAVGYIKGVLCDCDCSLRNNKLHKITFSTSSKEEGVLIKNILYKYFGIFSREHQDPRNKCYYIRITHYDNYLRFAKYGLFDSISWKGNNSNYNKFVDGFLLHPGSFKIMNQGDEKSKEIVYFVRSMYPQSRLKDNVAALQ